MLLIPLLLLQVAVLQSSLPHLQELHVAGNAISSLHVQLEQQQDRPHLLGFNSLQVGQDLQQCCYHAKGGH